MRSLKLVYFDILLVEKHENQKVSQTITKYQNISKNLLI